mmetsp:Transcript_28121/g.52741  ORF Transcript_28121/g.52741 Transcript_28121/m.52741 type:complete len:320 (-) Transcript_28121:295-1254(-)
MAVQHTDKATPRISPSWGESAARPSRAEKRTAASSCEESSFKTWAVSASPQNTKGRTPQAAARTFGFGLVSRWQAAVAADWVRAATFRNSARLAQVPLPGPASSTEVASSKTGTSGHGPFSRWRTSAAAHRAASSSWLCAQTSAEPCVMAATNAPEYPSLSSSPGCCTTQHPRTLVACSRTFAWASERSPLTDCPMARPSEEFRSAISMSAFSAVMRTTWSASARSAVISPAASQRPSLNMARSPAQRSEGSESQSRVRLAIAACEAAAVLPGASAARAARACRLAVGLFVSASSMILASAPHSASTETSLQALQAARH